MVISLTDVAIIPKKAMCIYTMYCNTTTPWQLSKLNNYFLVSVAIFVRIDTRESDMTIGYFHAYKKVFHF